jgi:hypothetical protein
MIYRGSVNASVSFFAWADDNRMPIRRVAIKWGDEEPGAAPFSSEGLYQNHKPFCGVGDTDVTPSVGYCYNNHFTDQVIDGLTCQVDTDCPESVAANNNLPQCWTAQQRRDYNPSSVYKAPRFGESPRACTTVPFNYQHIYSCRVADVNANATWVKTVSDLQDSEKNILIETYGLTPDSKVCVYQPAVQVLDNWGWCNGTCADPATGVVDPKNGCFGESGETHQCRLNSDGDSGAWTKYQGQIIVLPSRQ